LPKRLPSARLLEAGLRAGRQMQVEPCEIPLAGAPEVLRCEAYFAVRLNNACAPKRFSAQATKDLPTGRDNAADNHFSATCSSTEGVLNHRAQPKG